MKRFYYISDDLDDLEQIRAPPRSARHSSSPNLFLSNDDVGLDNHDVNRVASFLKNRCHSLRLRSAHYLAWFWPPLILLRGDISRASRHRSVGTFCFSGH